MVAFLAVLCSSSCSSRIYWLYDIGLPVVGVEAGRGRGPGPAGHGHLAAATRCSWPTARAATAPNGQGGIGPPLNDQAKLYNAVTATGAPGTGHLNPNYIHNVLTVGGRYVCGDPNSVMPVWAAAQRPAQLPAGPGDHRLDHGEQGRHVHVRACRREGAGGATAPPPHDRYGLARPELHAAARCDARAGLLEGRQHRQRARGRRPSAPVTSPGTAA